MTRRLAAAYARQLPVSFRAAYGTALASVVLLLLAGLVLLAPPVGGVR